MNPTLENLARYIAQELERAVPESTISASLRESGWTSEWIKAGFATAKQRAVPAPAVSFTMPHVQIEEAPLSRQGAIRPARQQPLTRPLQPTAVAKTIAPAAKPRSLRWLRNTLILIVGLLSITVLGLGIYKTVGTIQKNAQQRVINDERRREDLTVLLSDLSDYYVKHKSYPTRSQLSKASFLRQNGFEPAAIADPLWEADLTCSQDGTPALAVDVTPKCYTYEATTGNNNGACNNNGVACTKAKISIWLETDKQAYSVTFDKNSQI